MGKVVPEQAGLRSNTARPGQDSSNMSSPMDKLEGSPLSHLPPSGNPLTAPQKCSEEPSVSRTLDTSPHGVKVYRRWGRRYLKRHCTKRT